MVITKTAKLKITSHTDIFNDTIDIYNSALSFYIDVVNKEFDNLLFLTHSKEKMMYIESITHRTASNIDIKYDFSINFYKFPSYLRRSVINEALGVVSSHYSREKLYSEEKEKALTKGKKFLKKPPTLNLNHESFPVFYKGNMYKDTTLGKSEIKVFKNNDLVLIDIKYKIKDLINRFDDCYQAINPTLIKKGKKYFLHIPFQTKVNLNSTPLNNQKVIGVDLGLTNSAVCSCIDSNGTVIDRLFINQSKEKDQIKTISNKLSKAKRISGTKGEKPNYWRKINGLQKYIVQNTVDEIVAFAVKNNADVIVFEHLGKMKLPKGVFGAKRFRAKLHNWAKQRIQEKTIQKAWSNGIRNSKILANGTSKFAFDGSGLVQRNSKKDLAKFQNNKIYNADLSASYNIASRYFTRAILKPLSEKIRLQIEANVPLIADRTSHTLSSLIRLQEVINHVNNTSVSSIYDKETLSIII